jgi:hypothetical protein
MPEAASQPPRHGAAAASRTLEDLAGMTFEELGALYAHGTVPGHLSALDGSLPGRLLATSMLGRGPALAVIRRLAAARAFPWSGKSFQASDRDSGEGINRLRVLGDRCRFTTRFDDSVLDGRPCVVLDYDLDHTPRFIRRIRDELREVSPGLFFGPAMVQARGRHHLLLYFAVDRT